MHLPPNTLLQGGKYRIERVLGQGGFGITYLATHTVLGTLVAIKEFFLHDTNSRGADGKAVTISLEVNRYSFESQRAKFRKEAQRLQKLNCEHIVKVYDYFDENNTSYYVMEYISGCSLDQWMRQRGGRLNENEVKGILRQILDALMVMHGQHLWHLDIKPNNIMRQSNGNIKLIDFGASKLIDPNASTLMTSSAVASTPGFAPLEQMSSDFSSFGPWTDFYALGATLYVLLTGNRPPAANQVINFGTSAFQFPSTVSQKMRDLIEWMMKPKHADRPQSFADIHQRLGVPPVPPPISQPTPQPIVNPLLVPQFSGNPQPQPVQHPISHNGTNSILILLISGVLTILLIAIGYYFAYGFFANSTDAPAQQEVTTATTENDAKALTTAALNDLKSATTAQQGIDKLNQAIAKGGKESTQALYTLAQLYGRVYGDKAVLANVEKLLPKDTKKAHELNEKAVAIDNTYYPSLYELGCDYMAGDALGAVDRDIDKAKEYFTQGIKYAQQANDTQFAKRFEIRLHSIE